ncbi:transporter [Gaetbulibacter sp. M240]|uniref:transporter n=1 Tax=Gaetbulibacter sp. M240 TaxID=3126511 RepID=UPI00374FB238
MKTLQISFFTITILFSSFLMAQEEDLGPLITDRPDATEAPSTIPRGYLQVETGGFYTKNDDNGLKYEEFTYNTTLIRLGLLDNLELRLGWNFVENSYENLNTTLSGFTPMLLGTKIAIAKEKNGWPEMGFMGHVYLPFLAGTDYRPETTGVDFRFALSHNLSKRSNLSYNLGMAWGNDSPEASYVYTVAYGYAVTPKFGLYAELYGDLPENSLSNHYWDAGLTYLVSNNVQIDATVGSEITKGQDILLSGGISFRLPTSKK